MAKYYEEYKILILAATFSGVYISSIEKIYGAKWYIKALKFLFALPAIILPLYLISSIKYQLCDSNEIGDQVYGYMMILFSSFTTFSAYAFFYYRNQFERAFELWDQMFQDELFLEDRQELLAKNKKITDGWLKIFGGLNILSCFGYFTAMFLNPEKKLYHPSGIPYRHQSPDYEIMNTLDLIVCIFGFGTLIVLDTMTMVFLSLEEAQFKHLRRSLGKILDRVLVTSSGEMQTQAGNGDSEEKAFEEVEKNIRNWINNHHKILRFHDEFLRIFSVLLSVKYSVFVILICLVCFLTIAGKFRPIDIGLSVVFCCNNYALFYVNVTFADSITETSALIFSEASGKSWYLYPKKLKTAFLVILQRSHKPVQYAAFRIYPLSSRGFLRARPLKILTSAYSFFTYMLQVNRKKGGALV